MGWFQDAVDWVSDRGKEFYDFTKAIGDTVLKPFQPFVEMVEGSSIYQKTLGGGASKFEKAEAEWTKKEYQEALKREELWRGEDIERAERWRQEDIERNSLANRMAEAKAAGLHTATAAMSGMGVSGSIQNAPMTRTGGRMPRQTPTASSPGIFGMSLPTLAAMTSQIMNDKATRNLMAAEARKITAEAENIETTNPYAEEKVQADIELTKALKESSDINDNFTEKQIEELAHNLEKSAEMGVRTNQTTWQGMAGEMAHEALDKTIEASKTELGQEAYKGALNALKEIALDALLPGRGIFRAIKNKKEKQ